MLFTERRAGRYARSERESVSRKGFCPSRGATGVHNVDENAGIVVRWVRLEIWDFGRDLMKNKELIRTLKFVLFSASAGLIELGSFSLLDALTSWEYWPKYLIALVLSVLWNFTLNRNFTFKSAGNVPVAMLKVALFYVVFTPASTLLGNYLAETKGWNDILVTILNMVLNFVLEYLYDRFYVFGPTIDTKDNAVHEN